MFGNSFRSEMLRIGKALSWKTASFSASRYISYSQWESRAPVTDQLTGPKRPARTHHKKLGSGSRLLLRLCVFRKRLAVYYTTIITTIFITVMKQRNKLALRPQ